jgi:hypothetical protein
MHKYPDKEFLHQRFQYKDGFLYYKKYHPLNVNPEYPAGRSIHTYADKGCYYRISIDDGRYYAHRLIWIYHFGNIPKGYEIDHISGDPGNNKIDNLRIVTRQDNARNIAILSNNTSGYHGICLRKDCQKYEVFIKVNGKKKYLGLTKELDDAIMLRKDAEKLYGFHENHGRRIING